VRRDIDARINGYPIFEVRGLCDCLHLVCPADFPAASVLTHLYRHYHDGKVRLAHDLIQGATLAGLRSFNTRTDLTLRMAAIACTHPAVYSHNVVRVRIEFLCDTFQRQELAGRFLNM
jgi:hypothetical protein